MVPPELPVSGVAEVTQQRSARRRAVRKAIPKQRRPVVPVGLAAGPDAERHRLAEYLKLLSWWLGRPPAPALPPRIDQTLRGLLAGQSEKEIARALSVSVHTVHEYVKELHRRLGVTSRGELLARFLPKSSDYSKRSPS